MVRMNYFFKRLSLLFKYNNSHARRDNSVPSPEQIIQMIASTTEDEIDCGQAFNLMHQYAELVSSGQDASVLLPAVHKHIEICQDCRQELEALLRTIQAVN